MTSSSLLLSFRFKPSKPKRAWSPSTHYALKFSADCLQSELYYVDPVGKRDEDCLYLNIWRPVKPKSQLLPVLLWIYGGAFIQGSSSRREVSEIIK